MCLYCCHMYCTITQSNDLSVLLRNPSMLLSRYALETTVRKKVLLSNNRKVHAKRDSYIPKRVSRSTWPHGPTTYEMVSQRSAYPHHPHGVLNMGGCRGAGPPAKRSRATSASSRLRHLPEGSTAASVRPPIYIHVQGHFYMHTCIRRWIETDRPLLQR